MNIEVQQDALATGSEHTSLGSVQWSCAASELGAWCRTSAQVSKLADFVHTLWAASPDAGEFDDLAHTWVHEHVAQLAFDQQVQALFDLQTWLSSQLGPDLRVKLQTQCQSLVTALCRYTQVRRVAQDARQSRLVLVGQLFASIAHELRNPLAVMESSVFLLRRQLQSDEGATRHLQKITRNVSRCHEIIHEVLEMIRDAPLRTQRLSAQEIWVDVQAHCPELGDIRWSLDAPNELMVSCEPRLLRQCLLNLVTNAQVAMQGRGEICCSTRHNEQRELVFEVQDSGPGFSQEWLTQGVQCLVSGHPDGHGLGLALAQSIAVRHGGRIELSNRPQGGACVRVTLPILDA